MVKQYQIVPMYGTPKMLQADDAMVVTIVVRTESEHVPPPLAGDLVPQHEIHANRGVIGSQAYAREFANSEPDPNDPSSPEMKWLSRGLYEGLTNFIARAKDLRFGLRAATHCIQSDFS
jgi:hypothetical protein